MLITDFKPPKRPVNFDVAGMPWRILIAAVAIVFLAASIVLKPRFELLTLTSTVIKVHLACAVAALVLGTSLMIWRKGKTFHRVGGWIFAVLMVTVAGISLLITEINPGHFTVIHVLSVFTLLMVPLGVFFARRHLVYRHRRTMIGIYFGALIIAGAFTFYPGRLMWQVFFGH